MRRALPGPGDRLRRRNPTRARGAGHEPHDEGGGAAGLATVGAAGVEIAQEVLSETQGAILPLLPYLDTLGWLFIAVALAGTLVAIYAGIDDWKQARR